MHIIIAGGSGQLGGVLQRWFETKGHQVSIIGRSVADPALRWDGQSDGPWMDAIDGADAVINVAGRSVSCRYHWRNLNEMMASRVDSALAMGRAIEQAVNPPKVWLQASTASIYPHNLGAPFDESYTKIGSGGPGAPAYWTYSVHIARFWELALNAAKTPHTRKLALRFGFTMNPERGSVFDWLMWMVRWRLSGPFLGGRQMMSWVHDQDVAGACDFLMDSDLEGAVNVVSPEPVANAEFMATLRQAAGKSWGLPVWPGFAEIGAWLMDTDVELMKKSRCVVPKRLLDAGYTFQFSDWDTAARDLVHRWRAYREGAPVAER